MKKKLTFLGIETSCDETAASVVREKSDGTGEILSNIVSSQSRSIKNLVVWSLKLLQELTLKKLNL